MNCLVSVYLSN